MLESISIADIPYLPYSYLPTMAKSEEDFNKRFGDIKQVLDVWGQIMKHEMTYYNYLKHYAKVQKKVFLEARIAVTGPGAAGKSTILSYFAQDGFSLPGWKMLIQPFLDFPPDDKTFVLGAYIFGYETEDKVVCLIFIDVPGQAHEGADSATRATARVADALISDAHGILYFIDTSFHHLPDEQELSFDDQYLRHMSRLAKMDNEAVIIINFAKFDLGPSCLLGRGRLVDDSVCAQFEDAAKGMAITSKIISDLNGSGKLKWMTNVTLTSKDGVIYTPSGDEFNENTKLCGAERLFQKCLDHIPWAGRK